MSLIANREHLGDHEDRVQADPKVDPSQKIRIVLSIATSYILPLCLYLSF